MEMKKAIKTSAIALTCAGIAVAAPALVPALAGATGLLGGLLLPLFKDDKSLGTITMNAIAGFMTEFGAGAFEKLPETLSREHNSDLERALATAYLEALQGIATQIKQSGSDELKEQMDKLLPLWKARIEKAFKEKDDEAIASLFLVQQVSTSNETTTQTVEKCYTNTVTVQELILKASDIVSAETVIADEIEVTLRRWLTEQKAISESKQSGIQSLGITSYENIPSPLLALLRQELPKEIPHRFGEIIKRDDFKRSWIAFQRSHLQAIHFMLSRLESRNLEANENSKALIERIEQLPRLDEFITELAQATADLLSHSREQEDKINALLEKYQTELQDNLSRLIVESTERLSREGKENTEKISSELGDLKSILEATVHLSSIYQIPSPPRDFTGREDELNELLNQVKSQGVTISGMQGMGGIGKTALAYKLAEKLKPDYPDGHLFIDLKGVVQSQSSNVRQQPLRPAEVMSRIINAYYPTAKLPESDDELRSLYLGLFEGKSPQERKRVLILLDNARDNKQVESFIPPPWCFLIVTSRQHFALAGMHTLDLAKLKPEEAHDLLLKMAPRIGDEADTIAKQCGYLPLALRLAASALAKSRTLAPADLVRRLQDKRERLELIEASLSLSYDLLSEELQKLWRELAVFPDSFDEAAAAAVWGIDDVGAAKDRLAEIDSYSLLEWNEETKRYRLHDLAKDFADNRLSEDEHLASQRRHAIHFQRVLKFAHDLYGRGNENIATGLGLFDLERVNIEAGQAWAASRIEKDLEAARLCIDYPSRGVYVLLLRQHPQVFIQWQEKELVGARQLRDKEFQGIALGNLGIAYKKLGEINKAIEYHEQALIIAREIGDRNNEGNWLGNLGIAYSILGEVKRSIEYYKQALTIAREIGNRKSQGIWLGNLGLEYLNLGEVKEAIKFFEQDLTITREIGDRENEGNVLGNLGLAYSDLGEVKKSIQYHEQALIIAREIGDRESEGNQIGNLGIAYSDLGEIKIAIEYYEQALTIAREIGDKRSEGIALGKLGSAYLDLGEVKEAIEHYQQSLTIAREIGDRNNEGAWLGNLGIAYKNLGQVKKAIELTEASLKIFEEIESPAANIARRNLALFRGENPDETMNDELKI